VSWSAIHHVTALAADPRRNLAFYTRVLGLRLVKKTVNFDDPGMYHFYFGDAAGAPGTLLTFFAIPAIAGGRDGVGAVGATAFDVPQASFGFWMHRLLEHGVRHEPPDKRFGHQVIAFRDPDGLSLELVFTPGRSAGGAWTGAVSAEHAIRGLSGVTLWLERADATARLLTQAFGFRSTGSDGSITRYSAASSAEAGLHVDLRELGGFLPARQGSGSVHHVAFRAADDAAQAAIAGQLKREFGLRPTPQQDRKYFRSVYFREPGGVLFEIATDGPGFAVDEPAEALGSGLILPQSQEGRRAAVEAALPPLS